MNYQVGVFDNEYYSRKRDKEEKKEMADADREDERRDGFWDEWYEIQNRHIDHLERLFGEND